MTAAHKKFEKSPLLILTLGLMFINGCGDKGEPDEKKVGEAKKQAIESVTNSDEIPVSDLMTLGYSTTEKDHNDNEVTTEVRRVEQIAVTIDNETYKYTVASGVTEPSAGWTNGFVRILKSPLKGTDTSHNIYSGTLFIGPNYGNSPFVEAFNFGKKDEPGFKISSAFAHSGQISAWWSIYTEIEGKFQSVGAFTEMEKHANCNLGKLNYQPLCFTASGSIQPIVKYGQYTSFDYSIDIKIVDVRKKSEKTLHKQFIVNFDESTNRYSIPDFDKEIVECGQSSKIGLPCLSW
jgi:hypothetical protein